MLKHSMSIQWKIFGYLLAFCFLLLIVLWLFQTVFLESFYTYIKFGQIEAETGTLSALLAEGDLDALESRIQHRGDVFVELIDAEGNNYLEGGGFHEGGYRFLGTEQRKALFARAQEEGGAFSMRYTSGEGDAGDGFALQRGDIPKGNKPHEFSAPPDGGKNNESIVCGQIVRVEGEERLLLVRSLLTPVQATVDTLRVQLLYISAIVLMSAVLMALFMSRRVSRPIARVNTAAKELSVGNYAVRFQERGYREVEELSDTLDHAAAELAKTDELRRDLIANVSHDLRTPLTLITGYAEMMRDIPGENNAENMQIIIDEANRLTSLVGSLLDLSQLQSGTVPLRMGEFSITEETRNTVGRFAKFSEQYGYQVRFDQAGDCRVEGDAQRIGQVINNFLVNAMTHGGEDKQILVRQTIEDERVRISVTDHGEGIAPDLLPHIWERYFKVDKVHKRSLSGAGLGLSIVKGILDLHPGMEYGVESEPGQGSTFWFSLKTLPPE